jgi:hypothetical protein
MKDLTYPVADEFSDHSEARGFGMVLNCHSNISHHAAWANGSYAQIEAFSRHPD